MNWGMGRWNVVVQIFLLLLDMDWCDMGVYDSTDLFADVVKCFGPLGAIHGQGGPENQVCGRRKAVKVLSSCCPLQLGTEGC